MVSPRPSWRSAPASGSGWPPSSCTPTSKEILVRVEGFSNTSATLRPASALEPWRSALWRSAPSSRACSSAGLRSSTLRKSRFAMGSELLVRGRVGGVAGARRRGEGPDPVGELGDVEGLLHDRVAAELVAQGLDHLGRAGEDQDGEGQGAVLAPQPGDHLGAAEAGHHHVQYDHGRVEPPGQLQTAAAVGGLVDLEALVLED